MGPQGYLVQIVQGRDVRVEHYAVVTSVEEMHELKAALARRYPDRLIDTVDLQRLREESSND